MSFAATNGKIEIFIDRLIGGGFEIEVDGEIARLEDKAAANTYVDIAVRTAQAEDMLWSIYGADKLR